jgi:hypothetical protein
LSADALECCQNEHPVRQEQGREPDTLKRILSKRVNWRISVKSGLGPFLPSWKAELVVQSTVQLVTLVTRKTQMKTAHNKSGQTVRQNSGCEPLVDRRRSRLFSIAEANRTLPLVRRVTLDVMRLSRSLRHLRFRLKFIALGGEELEQLFPAEIRALRRRMLNEQQRLEECLDELLNLGIEPEAPTLGIVDFPAVIDGQAIYLCWRVNEPAIAWWHASTGGFVDRQPLTHSGKVPFSVRSM